MNITIDKLKRQLAIEPTFTTDDTLLQSYLDIAEVAVETYLGVRSLTGFTGNTMPITIHQGVILLAAHFYLNRNLVSFSQGTEIPYGFRWLLDPYKDWVVG